MLDLIKKIKTKLNSRIFFEKKINTFNFLFKYVSFFGYFNLRNDFNSF